MLDLKEGDSDIDIDGDWLLSVGFTASLVHCSGDPEDGIPSHVDTEYRIKVPLEDYEDDDCNKWLVISPGMKEITR